MENLKLLRIFNSTIEAEIAKSFLSSNNIKSWIFADDAGSMYPSQDIVNGVKLMVAIRDFEDASALLDSMEDYPEDQDIENND